MLTKNSSGHHDLGFNRTSLDTTEPNQTKNFTEPIPGIDQSESNRLDQVRLGSCDSGHLSLKKILVFQTSKSQTSDPRSEIAWVVVFVT